MNFLNSAILAALAAAVLPLLIHLLNRQKVRTVEFSSLMFLRNLQKTKMRRLKLRQVLLLLVRTLIVAAAVLAFARPTITGDTFAGLGARARTSAVILVDNSASMQERTADGSAVERAARDAGELIGLLREGDQVVAGTFSATAEFGPATSDFAGLTKRFRDLPAGAGKTDIMAAIAAGEQVVTESRNLNREIYLFSDLARNGMTTTGTLPPPNTEHPARLYLINVHDPRAINAAVTDLRFSGELIEPGVGFEITATVTNRSTETFDHLLVGVFVDGRRVAQDDLSLRPAETSEISFRIELNTTGLHRGYIELADDDNIVDNRFYFAVRLPESTNILLASDFPSERAFVRRALAPGGTGRLSVTGRNTRELLRTNLAEYDALVLVSARKPEPVLSESIDRYLRAGGGVMIIPDVDIDTAIYNQTILRRYFGLSITQTPDLLPPTDQFFTLAEIDWQHPILAIYRDIPDDRMPEIKFFSSFTVDAGRDVKAIMRFSNGEPALLETGVGRGKLLFWCAPLNADYTDLSYHSLFVPLMGRSAEYLAADLGEQDVDYRVGQSVTRARPPYWRGPLVLEYPDGRRDQLAPEVAGKPDVYATPNLGVPGCYLVYDNDRPVDIFAVNIDAEETNIEPISDEEIERRLPGRSITVLRNGDDLAETVRAARYGREIWKYFLWAVVGLLLIETLLARTRKSELPPDMLE